MAISETSEMQYFSLSLNSEQGEKLGSLRKKQIIFEVASIAAVLAFSVWESSFRHQRCILFVDNEGTKGESGVSENRCAHAVVEIFASLEADVTACLWVARVASASNNADEPSRGVVSKLEAAGATSVNHSAIPAFLRIGNGETELRLILLQKNVREMFLGKRFWYQIS